MRDLNSKIAKADSANELLDIVRHLEPVPVGFFLGRRFTYKNDAKQMVSTVTEGNVPLQIILEKAVELQKTTNPKDMAPLAERISRLDSEASSMREKSLKNSALPVQWFRRLVAFVAHLFFHHNAASLGLLKDQLKLYNTSFYKDSKVVKETFERQMKTLKPGWVQGFFINVLLHVAGAFFRRKDNDGSQPNFEGRFNPDLIHIIKAKIPVKQFWAAHACDFSRAFIRNTRDLIELNKAHSIEQVLKDDRGMYDATTITVEEALKMDKDVLYMLGDFFLKDYYVNEFHNYATLFLTCAIKKGYIYPDSDKGEPSSLTKVRQILLELDSQPIPDDVSAEELFVFGQLCSGKKAKEYFVKALNQGLDINYLNIPENQDALEVYHSEKNKA